MNCHFFVFSWLIVLIMVFNGCSTTTETLGPQSMEGAMAGEPLADYRLRPGDEVEIKFFYHPTLDETVMIGPDGKISLQLIDQVLAAGLTSAQLDELLTEEYATHLENYSISVLVRDYAGLKVYVGGEVREPGFLSLKGNMSVLQSIFAAKGFKDTAQTDSVILVRKGPDNRPVAMAINLEPVLSGEQLENDVYLMSSDIIYVPKSWVAKAGTFVKLYMKDLLFFDSVIQGVGYSLGYQWVTDR